MDVNREKALDLAVSQIERQFGKGAIMFVLQARSGSSSFISRAASRREFDGLRRLPARALWS